MRCEMDEFLEHGGFFLEGGRVVSCDSGAVEIDRTRKIASCTSILLTELLCGSRGGGLERFVGVCLAERMFLKL